MKKVYLGSCYYPEHWPENLWAEDAQRMVDAGLSVVRIGEFAWSRIEPEPEQLSWDWLDRAFNTLAKVGLEIVLCTPTATPPRWMLDRYPDLLALDSNGLPRKFGSRRHYCFSHPRYLQESQRIAALIADRYAGEKQLYAWQIDNEYGCHDTVVSYSEHARLAFRKWLIQKYPSIEALNESWGNVFWSMEYNNFDQIELPNLTVTEPNPAHVMDFRRFSSDQVVNYNRAQANVVREYSQAPLIHNYMGRITDFDHFSLGEDLDIASWDSYPLGFLADRSNASESRKVSYDRQGDPDFQAFHHDLYRAVGKGRWWVMEQQPGPVNWAPYNPAPLRGMVRLWTLEAIAHGAEAVCYFRWRQSPYAQEQMHSGLLRPDSQPSASFAEITSTADEVQKLGLVTRKRAQLAIVFDYESCWAWQTQPQGESFDYFDVVFEFYQALRRLGVAIDILPPTTTELDNYKLVVIPALMYWPDSLQQGLANFSGIALVGPRSGSKTRDFSIPLTLAPDLEQLGVTVQYVESLATGVHARRELEAGGYIHRWLESLLTDPQHDLEIIESLTTGEPVLVAESGIYYLAGCPDHSALQRILTGLCTLTEIETVQLPKGVRTLETASHRFIFNYGSSEAVLDGRQLAPASVEWQRLDG